MGSTVFALPTIHRIGPANPDFDVSRQRLRAAWRDMRANPKPLERPVIIISGWRSMTPAGMARNLCQVTSQRPADFMTVSYPLAGDFDRAIATCMKAIHARFPGPDASTTAEVDVVGISMGGLVARAAAVEGVRPRLAIRRLFTLATPHRGAKLARKLGVDGSARSMRAGSEYLTKLDQRLRAADYDLVCYTRLGDAMVGARNTAPHGREPIWIPAAMVLSHLTIAGDRAIAADVARRLRGEEPLGREGGAPPRD